MSERRCPGCRAEVLEVVTGTGLEVTLDPHPLTVVDELVECVAGGHTYTRHDTGPVHPRFAHTILGRPAGHTARQAVHARHRCNHEEWQA